MNPAGSKAGHGKDTLPQEGGQVVGGKGGILPDCLIVRVFIAIIIAREGLEIAPGVLFRRLDREDYQPIVDDPKMARAFAESVCRRLQGQDDERF